MPQFRLSPRAQQDIEAILTWTHGHFGEQARFRYQALLVRAILDLAAEPNRPACIPRPELAAGAMTYHVLHSRNHVPNSTGRVRKPRHFLLFRIAADGCLEISRVLHDSMDLERHLPQEYQTPAPDSETRPL